MFIRTQFDACQLGMVFMVVCSRIGDIIRFVRHRVIQSPIGNQAVFVTGQQAVIRIFNIPLTFIQRPFPKADLIEIAIEAFTDCHIGRLGTSADMA